MVNGQENKDKPVCSEPNMMGLPCILRTIERKHFSKSFYSHQNIIPYVLANSKASLLIHKA
jgi:hypothetical protein